MKRNLALTGLLFLVGNAIAATPPFSNSTTQKNDLRVTSKSGVVLVKKPYEPPVRPTLGTTMPTKASAGLYGKTSAGSSTQFDKKINSSYAKGNSAAASSGLMAKYTGSAALKDSSFSARIANSAVPKGAFFK